MRYFWNIIIFTIASLFALRSPAPAQIPTQIPTLIIAPPGEGFRELFEHPDDWSDARAMTGAILHADHDLTHISDTELQKWFAMMRAWNIPLELEVGAIKEWAPSANATFQAEQPIWDRALRLGADLASIAMDEPLAAARSLHQIDAYAIDQTAQFIALVRQRYPAMRIGDIEPYPGISLPDHIAWITQLQSRLRQQNVAPLDFYRIDVDWVAFTKAARGNWQEVASLATAARGSGLPFSLIYWASAYPSQQAAGRATDDAWYVQVLAQGHAVADAGIRPDQFVLESWIHAPSRVTPESAEYSFTRSVRDFGHIYIAPDGYREKPRGQ